VVVGEVVIRGTATAAAVGKETESDELSSASVLDAVVSGVELVVVLVALSVDLLVVESPVMVVRDRGTAVQRFPLIVVIRNRAGRFALVDIMEMRKQKSRFLNIIYHSSLESGWRGFWAIRT
jgi:hypothetical protein